MTHYQLLGVGEDADLSEIKKAFRRRAMILHPDRGGSQEAFSQLQTAYSVLSDPLARQEYDEEHINEYDLTDIIEDGDFDEFSIRDFFRVNRPTATRYNQDIDVDLDINYQQVLTGTKARIAYRKSSGNASAWLKIPQGTDTGDVFTLRGLGDDEYPESEPGDLNITIRTINPPGWQRMADDVITEHSISALDAITGCVILVETLEHDEISLTIPPATQSKSVFTLKERGFCHRHTGKRGDMYVTVDVTIPEINDKSVIQAIQEIKSRI